jgi:hypothetical protein
MSVMLKTRGSNGGISRSSSFGEQQKSRNLAAEKRMRMNRTPPKLLGYDYGGGRVVETAK